MGDAGGMDAVYPAAASALERGRRRRGAGPRTRHRTLPVTFAEIKEVDEDTPSEDVCATSAVSVTSVAEERRRRPDLLDERFTAQFAESRRRRARRTLLREPDEAPSAPRAASEPRPDAGPS
ncbi:uncharacterized protein LOC120625285 [Pararge aegeria]|uniref:uncharacterized protein LOC120625285 n=1 Tax=Pararge aegeria TaxID=116150 RepID=UPI0019D08CF0|nr:uncharacterized protein LOC120625285 [Pararge aegeria]XP_039748239.1 uncharacterized protein LOC120625285 [Pararge aegeria]